MITIKEWARINRPDETMIWKDAFDRQINFVKNLARWFYESSSEAEKNTTVISTHTSKSIVLPVYQIERADTGLKLILRGNFHDWKLSVISDTPINVDLSGLCHTTPPVDPAYTGNPLAPIYFQGFPRDLIFDYYDNGYKKKWSAEFWDDSLLTVALFLISRAVGIRRAFTWSVDPKRTEVSA